MTVWQIEDMTRNAGLARHDELLWLIAASPMPANDVIARHQALNDAGRKDRAMDDFMERLAAEKRAKSKAAAN